MTNLAIMLAAVLTARASCAIVLSAIFHYVNSKPMPQPASARATRLVLVKR